MKTMQPVLKRGRDFWDRVNMPLSEFQKRVERIKHELKKAGVELLLLYGNGVDHYGNPCYISNYAPTTPGGVIVAIPQESEVCLIAETSSRSLPYLKTKTWVEQIRHCKDLSKECVKYLKESKLMPSTCRETTAGNKSTHNSSFIILRALSSTTCPAFNNFSVNSS